MADKVIEELQKIGDYTGLSLDSIYKMLERQANLHLIYNILGILGCICVILVGLKYIKYFDKKAERSFRFDELRTIVTILTIGAFLLSIVIIPKCVVTILEILFNKPVWILEYLTGMIK